MHNHRREDFLHAQRRARARNLILDRYIAERVAKRDHQQSGEQVGAIVHALPAIGKPSAALRYAAICG